MTLIAPLYASILVSLESSRNSQLSSFQLPYQSILSSRLKETFLEEMQSGLVLLLRPQMITYLPTF